MLKRHMPRDWRKLDGTEMETGGSESKTKVEDAAIMHGAPSEDDANMGMRTSTLAVTASNGRHIRLCKELAAAIGAMIMVSFIVLHVLSFSNDSGPHLPAAPPPESPCCSRRSVGRSVSRFNSSQESVFVG